MLMLTVDDMEKNNAGVPNLLDGVTFPVCQHII